jgi:hypothetical protein
MFIIKSFHYNAGENRNRLHFWQCPWVVPYDDKPEWREIGGWVTSSRQATIYPTEQEGNNVNALRALRGEVVNAGRYLQVGG